MGKAPSGETGGLRGLPALFPPVNGGWGKAREFRKLTNTSGMHGIPGRRYHRLFVGVVGGFVCRFRGEDGLRMRGGHGPAGSHSLRLSGCSGRPPAK